MNMIGLVTFPIMSLMREFELEFATMNYMFCKNRQNQSE